MDPSAWPHDKQVAQTWDHLFLHSIAVSAVSTANEPGT